MKLHNRAATPSPIQTAAPPGDGHEISVSVAPAALKDKNWRIRKASNELLAGLVSNELQKGQVSTIPNDAVLQGLDELAPLMKTEKNASALHAALQVAVIREDHCSGSSISERATKSLLESSRKVVLRPERQP